MNFDTRTPEEKDRDNGMKMVMLSHAIDMIYFIKSDSINDISNCVDLINTSWKRYVKKCTTSKTKENDTNEKA